MPKIDSTGTGGGFERFCQGVGGDTPDIAALTAPRALHLNLGENDNGSPIEEARAGVARIAAAYASAGVPEQFGSFIEPAVGHVLSPSMWEKTRDWFARHLRG